MILRILSQAHTSASTADYMVDEHHDSQVLSTTLMSVIGEPAPRRAAMANRELHSLADYMDDAAKSHVVGRSISPEALAEMEMRSAMRPDVERPWMHMALSYGLADRDRVTDSIMADDVDSIIRHLVVADNDWKLRRAEKRGHHPPEPTDPDGILHVAVVHRERAHLHVHILMCRIDSVGHLYAGFQNHCRAREWCIERERFHGFQPTPEHALERDDDGRVLSPTEEIERRVQTIADQAVDRDDLTARLAEHGLHLKAADRGGWKLSDEAGTTISASQAGLYGIRAPHRIGGGTPTDVARAELWEAAVASPDYATFQKRLAKTGLVLETDQRGTVVEVHRVDVQGNRMEGRSWSTQELGFRYPPNANRWRQPQPRKKDRDGADRSRTILAPEPAAQRTQGPPERILLVPPAADRGSALDRICQERDAIVAKRAAARAAEMEASKARIEARRAQQAQQQALEQQRLAQERLVQEQTQAQVRAALADRPDAVPDRASPSADTPRPEPSPSVDVPSPDTAPDDPPPKPFRMDR